MANKETIQLVEHFEGCKLAAYECATSKSLPRDKKFWTIGWGSTFYADKKPVGEHDHITQEQADELFENLLNEFEAKVKALVTVQLNENQLGALTSFAYNCGVGNLKSSTLLKKVNAGDFIGASQEFAKWNKSNGTVLKGLVVRRAKEAELFLK
jgi:lysozyme